MTPRQVYLDACLHPNILDPILGPQILKQEGWHYEADDDESSDSSSKPLKFKGVVFNEMKGVRDIKRACVIVMTYKGVVFNEMKGVIRMNNIIQCCDIHLP
jgi:Zn-dependent M16 (insulinase) family peptidase